MLECRCRTKQYEVRKTNDAGLSFSLAFRHPCIHACALTQSMLHNQMLHVHVHVACSCQCCISCQCFMSMSMSIDIYIEMPDCLASGQSGTGLKKLTMPKPVWYRTKLRQSGIFLVRYWTKIRDAGMPMPALVSSIPMPSYAQRAHK